METFHSDTISIRPLRTFEEFDQCVELQRETWGEGFSEVVPPSLLLISQKIGGVAAGAFDSSERLVGFVFGFSGVRKGRLVHWSDMLAVRKELAGRGIGRRLKEFQRQSLLELGIETALWTCDPLVAANAHLNFNRLGARPVEYVVDLYGSETGSNLHSGIGTDRFIMEWNLKEPLVVQSLKGDYRSETSESSEAAQSPVINSSLPDGTPRPVEGDPPDLPIIRLEIPHDIQQIKTESLEVALLWRSSTRHAFLWYMERGYKVSGFVHYSDIYSDSHRCHYILREIQA